MERTQIYLTGEERKALAQSTGVPGGRRARLSGKRWTDS